VNNSNVIDFCKKSPLFCDPVIRQRLQDSLAPYLKDSADDPTKEQAISAIEQALCTLLVSYAKDLAVKAANKVVDKLLAKNVHKGI